MSEPAGVEARSVVGSADPLVYYIRRNGLIKIGYTARFVDRMRDLRPDELLAVEPGNVPLETARHLQFAAYRVREGDIGREWYQPVPELIGHIARMAAAYEAPVMRPVRAAIAPQMSVQRGPILDFELAAVVGRAFLGDTNLDELDTDTLVALSRAAVRGRELLHHTTLKLTQRGLTFADIAKELGVHRAQPMRWVREHPSRKGDDVDE